MYGAVSCVITCIVEIFLGMNMPLVLRLLGQEELAKKAGMRHFKLHLW